VSSSIVAAQNERGRTIFIFRSFLGHDRTAGTPQSKEFLTGGKIRNGRD